MKEENRKNVIRSNTFLALLAIAIFATVVTKTAMAKSLYVIADIKRSTTNITQPVQAYDIGVDGTLTFQAQHDIPHKMLGAVGMAIDSDYGYIFITYEASGEIQLIEAKSMTNAGTTIAPDAMDLAGIVYDHKNSLLYCVDRGTNSLYVYNWWPETATLTHTPGSPFRLQNASAFGIALDEIDDLLYVGNASNTITVYSTSDWSLVDTISVSRIAISIAVDVTHGFVYTGGGYAGNMYLTQYHLATGTEAEVQVEPDAGVMGLGVDTDTGLIYMGTGINNAPGGDNLLVYDAALNQIDIVTAIGNPSGLAIPGRDIGYNPLNLKKEVLRGASTSTVEIPSVGPGNIYTYGISFDNTNDYTVTDVLIIDLLPNEVSFKSADDDGVNGYYDPTTHTYQWSYQELPPQTSIFSEITVQVNPDIDAGTIIKNSVTINSNETAPTTTSVNVMTTSYPLNLKKTILGSIEGQIAQVESNDIITYAIDFDNKNNDFPVMNVIVVDELPENVTFISADNGKGFGKYDDKAHTYTWTFIYLEPGEVVHLELAVSVNPNLAMGTTITNIVTIDSDETPKSAASVDAMTFYKPLNITKKAINSSGSEIEWIEPGERFIYQICFDNNNNDSQVTDVFLNDTLPSEVTFLAAQVDNRNFIGYYDLKKHTYTGSLRSLEPGLVTCLELEVEANQDTPLYTIISNSVIIDSNEMLPTIANVNIVADVLLLEVDNLEISTSTISHDDALADITFIIELPEGIGMDDVVNEPLILNPGYIEASDQQITESDGRIKITAVFDKNELLSANPDYYGILNLEIVGKLNSGQTFSGEATITIIKAEDISAYISYIGIEQIWDYNDPLNSTDLTYEFNLLILSLDYMAMNMNTHVDRVDFLTPAGNTYEIPKLPGQSSDGIWASYEYDPNLWGGMAIWEYSARFTALAYLQAYGDGEYTITLHYTDGSQNQTTAWFGIPDTQEPIPQPTQEPILTFPLYNQTVESPVTLTWESCADSNTKEILINMEEQITGTYKYEGFDVNETSWNLANLTDGVWGIQLFFNQSIRSYNNDEINVGVSKSSRSKYEFTVVSYPTSTYEVWGGDIWIEIGWFGNFADLEANGYVRLGEPNHQTATFPGEYQYYLIATRWQFLLDSIQGSDGSYYSLFKPNNSRGKISNGDYLLGPPDGLYATVGDNYPWEDYWDDYSGWIAFTNPGNWMGLTIITRNLNLNLTKSVVGTVGEIDDIDPNDTITYRICFDSNDFTQDVTDVTVVDILPDEVSFVSADSNEFSGTYDPDKHTYTWLYQSLAPESAIEMQLTVQVNPDVVPGTAITNFATINSNETLPYTTSINVMVVEPIIEIPPLEVDNLSIIPNVLRRNGTSQYITAVIQFPEGIKQSDIDLDGQPELYYQDRNTEEFILIGKGSRPDLSGSEDRPKISISFNRAELMDAVYGYGEFKLRIEGTLKTSRSYFGEDIIHITRFTGD